MSGPLSPGQTARVYDRIGRAQDWQSFYEDPAADRLVANAGMESATSVFELGCGTGRLAERLFRCAGPGLTYCGVDISPVMVRLATERLARSRVDGSAQRARVLLMDGSDQDEGVVALPAADGSVDRFFSTFVFDLLAQDHARTVLAEAARVLVPGGLVCLTSLAPGESRTERMVSRAWMGLWYRAPSLVGGCRPISLLSLVDEGWRIGHHSFVRAYGLVSEVVVASPR